MIAAVFDLDGTLYTGHIVNGMARHHRTHRVNRLPFFFYMTTHMPMWPLWRLGLMSEGTARELWASHLGWTMRGMTHQEADTAFAWITEHYVLPRVRPDVLARLRDHQTSGHRVILVSGTLSPLLAEIGRRLEVEETVGTPLTGTASPSSRIPSSRHCTARRLRQPCGQRVSNPSPVLSPMARSTRHSPRSHRSMSNSWPPGWTAATQCSRWEVV